MSYPRIVVDTNKVLAAILRPGRVRRTLFDIPALILTPREAWVEAGEHIEEIASRKRIPRDRLEGLLERIRAEAVVEKKPREPYIGRAKRIAGRFDPDDWPFIALALQEDAVLWTNDRGLLGEAVRGGYREYTAVDTTGLQMLLEGKSKGEVLRAMKTRYLG